MSREGNRQGMPRGPMGGGRGMRGPAEKAKDFKGTIYHNSIYICYRKCYIFCNRT